MEAKHSTLLAPVVLLAVLAAAGCGGDRSTEPALADTDPVVFDDEYGNGVYYQPFMNSSVDLVTVTEEEFSLGTRSLRIEVPGPGGGDIWYAGGAFTCSDPRDLSGYNALTFYARSEINSTLDVVGLGNDNTGTSLYEASRTDVPLTNTEWTYVVVPIPDPSKLTLERGLFYFAEGHENNESYVFWLDDVRFDTVDGITDPQPSMDEAAHTTFVGGTVDISGTSTVFEVARETVTIGHQPAYFDYTSSDELVATVWYGTIQGVGGGTATISAKLDTVDVDGEVFVNVFGPPAGPAPTPTVPAEDVISLFSDVYDDVPVDTWHAPWEYSTGEVTDMVLNGDNVKVYTELNFAGVVFEGENLIDIATPGMTYFHMDVWAPSGGLFLVKLVDFGANGTYDGGGDDTFGELLLNGGTEPPFFSGQWSSLEIPLSAFTAEGLSGMEHMANLVISSSDVSTVIVDNVYFHR